MTLSRRLTILMVASLLLSISASAATTDFRILFDVDRDLATGCTVSGMAGVDQILVTRMEDTGATARVVRTHRQLCEAGVLGAPVQIDESGWPAGYQAASGAFLLETRISSEAFPPFVSDMRLGFEAIRGSSTQTVVSQPTGGDILFPESSSRRRSVRSADGERLFVLDGLADDWTAITPLVSGIAAGGSTTLRLTQIRAAAAVDGFFYFRFDGTISSTAPFAEDDAYTRNPGEGLSVPAPGVLLNDDDPSGLPLTAQPVSPATHGDVTLNPDGSFTYAPTDPSIPQTDVFEYRATNGTLDSNVARVTIKVASGSVSAPVGVDDAYATSEDTPLSVPAPGVLANDTDANGDTLTAAFLSGPSHGNVTLNPNGGFTYTPSPNYFGTDSFSYTVSDGSLTSTAVVTITIASVNDEPVVKGAVFTIDENSPNGTVVGTVDVSDKDSADEHTFAIIGGNLNGAFAIDPATGEITVANAAALDFETTSSWSLLVRATDNGTPPESDSATIVVNLNDLNDAPLAFADAQSVAEDGVLNVAAPGVLANDTDQDGDALTAVLVTGPANASAFTLNADGSWSYTPAADFFGTDSFTYRASDGLTQSNVATVTITVTAVNDAPTFTAGGNVASNEDTAFNAIWATAVSAGPANESAQTLIFITSNDNNALFSVQPALAADGTLTFTPAPNATGTANVTVTLQDNGAGTDTSAPANFVITITAVNDPPSFTGGGNVSINEDSGAYSASWAAAISAGPADEAGQTLTFVLSNDNNALFAVQPAISAAGVLTFTPAANANGTASVTVTLQDDGGGTNSSAPVVFTITVNAVNDAPVFTGGGDVTSAEDAAFNAAWATAISAGPADEGSQVLTFNVTANTNTTLFAVAPAVSAAGTLTFTPSPDANGFADITIQLNDDGGTALGGVDVSAPVTFRITITAVNDPPTFNLAGNQVTGEDSGPQTVNGFASSISVGPANESAQTLTSFNVTNDNNGLFSAQPAIDTLGNLTYTPAPNAFGVATVSVTATDSDGATSSPAQTFTITVSAINDNPVVTAGATLNYTENQAATAIDATITVNDVDSPVLTGATVQVSNNFASGEDVLSFTDIGAITFVSYSGGILTLGGTDTVANYQAALRTVAYSNTSDNPSTLARTISWQVNDGAGVNNLSAIVTSTVNVASVNDVPTVNAVATLGYTEGTGAVAIDPALTLTDLDDTQMSGATIAITTNFVSGEDVLAFTPVGSITGAFAAGTLTLSGTDTIANYQTALRSVTYLNTSANPSVASRTVTWTVSDMTPAPGSDTTDINITPVNSAPVLTAGGTLNYSENDGASVIDNAITVTEVDTPNLVGATAQITGNYVNGEDVLSYVPALGITGTFNAATGTLTLTGTTTPANWQTALRNVLYTNTSDDPSTAARTVTWQIDDGEAVDNLSNTPTSTINVAAFNDAPVVAAIANVNYTEDDGAVTIDASATVTDLDNVNLTGGSVQITGNYVSSEDVLAFTNAFGITAAFNAGTGTLTLSGTTTVANYQSALRTITYQNTSQSPSTAVRTITWTVSDGTAPGSDTTTITVASVNDAPALTIAGAVTYTENDPATNAATSSNVTDADDTNIESATIQITGNYQNGQDVLSYTTALGITGVFTPATGTLTLTGSTTLANYITALQAVQYANTSEAPSTLTRTLTWTVNDGDTNSNAQSSTIAVITVNDAPVNSVPGAQVTNEDVPITFNAANLNLISVSDADAGASAVQVTLTVAGGTVTASAGATIGGNGTASVTLTGTIANVNASLDGLVFNPTPNSFGVPAGSITVTTDDLGATGTGGAQQDSDVIDISINAVNDAPVLAVAATPTPSFIENGVPITIATSAGISDVDDANIESATVQITGNYDNGGDVLAYTTALGITGVFTPATGTLTLTGSAPLASYATALQNITFISTSENPSALQRTVTWTVNDGDTNSNSQITNINVLNVNDPPVINASDLPYVENAGPVALDGALTANDPDDTALPSATVQITTNYVNGEDILAFTDAFGITGSFDAPGGTLTLTGPASPADFQAALRSVTYENTSDTPSVAPRTVTWTLSDDEPSSGTDTTTITVTATNDAPVLTLSGTLNYTEDDPATNIASSASITDGDDTNIETATVQITGNYQNGQDVLSYLPNLGITGSFDAPTGTLTLTGPATLANFATALQNVQYENTSESPSTLARTVTYTVNDGDTNSNNQTATINVTSVNDAPVVTPTVTPLAYTENDPATNVQPLITVTDVDSANITGATVQITTNFQNGQDVLSYVNALGITGTFSPATGTLTLSGTTTVANYQTALRSVKYNNTSENPSQLPRTVAWQVNDGAGVNNLSTLQNSTINVIAVNDAPTVVNNTFDVIGNTELRVDMVAGTTPNAAETVNDSGAFQGVLFNDSDVEGDPFVITAIGNGCGDVTAPFDCALSSGAVVHVDANGEFSFTPGPGDTNDSFTYTVTDTPSVGTAASSTGTVTFTFNEMVWYVKQGATGGNGTSISPFGNFDDLDGAGGAGDLDDAADYIFIHDSGALAATATVPLEINQHVLGEGVGLSIPVDLNGNGSPTNLVSAGTSPVVTLAAGDLFTIGAAMPVEIRGLNLTATAGNVVEFTTAGALSGSATLTISNNVIGGAGAEGIDINMNAGTTGTLALTISNNSWNLAGTHTGNAIDVVRTAGTLRLAISNNTNVLSTSAAAISVNGAITITGFASNTIHQNTVGQGVFINNATFDADAATAGYQQVAGGTTVIGASGNGVGTAGMTLTNVAGDIAFTDLDIFADNGAGFTLTGTGAVNTGGGTGTRLTIGASVGVIEATNGPAVTVSNATIDMQLSSLKSVNSTTKGVSLTNVSDGTTGAMFSAGSGSSIVSAAAASGPIFEISGGNAGISYAGTITNNSTSARAVSVTTWAGDDAGDNMTFSGAIDENGAGILVNGNAGVRLIAFTGGLDIDTTTGEGFAATGNTNSLGVNVTGTTNDISSISATALRVTSTTIGAGGMAFRNVSSGNNTAAADPVNGIVLNATGTSGSLTVAGNAGAGTGGTIQNTTGDAISLTSTQSPSFSWMNISTTGGQGINTNNMTAGFTFANCQVSNTGDGDNEHALKLFDISGTVSLQGVSFNNTAEDFINVDSSANNSTLTLNIGTSTACTFTQPNTIGAIRAGGAFAGNGILIQQRNSKNYTVNLSNSTFTDVKLSGIQLGSSGTSNANNVNVNLDNNDFLVTIANSLGNPNNRSNGINIQALNILDIDAAITNNTLDGGGGGGIQLGADNGSNLAANILNNVVSDQFADGILMAVDENATLTVLIDGNTISNTSSDGMEIANAISPGGTSTLNATITNNNVTTYCTNTGANAFVGGIAVFGGADVGDNTRLDVRNNNVSGSPSSAFADYWIDGSSFSDAIEMKGPGTAAVTEASFLAQPNTAGSAPGQKTFIGNTFYNNNVAIPTPVLTP